MQKKPKHQFTIEEALQLLVNDKKLQKGLNENVIKQKWAEIMGAAIAKHTTGLYLNNGKLIVYFNSSVVKNEVLYHREKALNLINEALGYEAVSELDIR